MISNNEKEEIISKKDINATLMIDLSNDQNYLPYKYMDYLLPILMKLEREELID